MVKGKTIEKDSQVLLLMAGFRFAGGACSLCIQLQKDGRALPLNRITVENGNMTIEKIKESDRGIYQCMISNDAAIVTVDTELMIEKFPSSPPYNLTANSTESSILLKWQPGSGRVED